MTTKILKNEFPNQNYNNVVLIKLDKIYNRKKILKIIYYKEEKK